MSRLGNTPIAIPGGTTAEIKGRSVAIKGPKGQLSYDMPHTISAEVADGNIVVKRENDARRSRELHGLTRSLISNMVAGVNSGYERKLEIYGTGYGCNLKGNTLELNLGYMGRSVNKGPQFSIPVPAGLEIEVEVPAARGESTPAKMTVRGIEKQKVGQFAAEIRALRKPEPYKGKGVRYAGEQIKRKQGKALASGG